MELLDYEKRHIEYLKSNASECALFLKRNDAFPISNPCKVVLVGNGVRHTIKGGTGSGDVYSRFFNNIEEEFRIAGFNITSKEWLDAYDAFKISIYSSYIKDVKREAKAKHIPAYMYSMGYFEEEKNYNFDTNYEGDICIYVLSRNSGEGNDRRNIEGDFKLSQREVEDILSLNERFDKFMLVLNVGCVIDLRPVMAVSNILLLSQLGVVTSSVLVDIVLGNENPSGKLSSTWAGYENYPCFEEFGNINDTFYKEGIYVGYRYFNTIGKDYLFPFGFGLSYTSFEYEVVSRKLNDDVLTFSCKVTNIGKFAGKEVLQLYVTKPNDTIEQPFIELVDYNKTCLLNPGESTIVSLTCNMLDLSTFITNDATNTLVKGDYIFRIGNSSIDLNGICKVRVDSNKIIERLEHKLICDNFEEIIIPRKDEDNSMLPYFEYKVSHITKKVEYKKDEYSHSLIETLSNQDLAYICLGHFDQGIASMVGSSCKHVVGGAGETVLRLPEISSSLTMADGPAGLRIKQEYILDNDKIYDVAMDPFMEKLSIFLPWFVRPFLRPKKHKGGKMYHQYTTALPIGTALAQSFSDSFIQKCASIVREEMDIFGVDLWLAPAMNIQRNVLCGRNFEYYSEDPYVSFRVASVICDEIQKDGTHGVVIKHFACNNQELNRNNNNSHVNERALRDIYLKGFERCIKKSNPKAIMTSYNLINGVHASESFELINDCLRCEWSYEGLVMTDWIASGRSFCKISKYPAPYASNSILAGNDLTMPGCPKDYNDILRALKKQIITRDDLIHSASRVYRSIQSLKGEGND